MSDGVKTRLSFIINIAFIAVVLLLVYLAFKYVVGWLLPFLLAFCIVSFIHPLTRVIEKRMRIKHEVVSIAVMALIYVIVGTILFLIVMQLSLLVRDVFIGLPGFYEQSVRPGLDKAGVGFTEFIENLPEQWQDQIQGIESELTRGLQSFLLSVSQRGIGALSNATGKVPSFLIGFVFTIMLSFFISMQYDKVIEFLKTQLPERVKKVLSDVRLIIRDTIFKYLRALFTLMLINFTEVSIGLLVLRTDYAIPIAAGIAVFDALPFFGCGAVLIPWGIIELLQGNFTYGFGLLILYGIVVMLRSIIEPKVVGDKLGLNPIVTLTAIYFGFKLFGVLGMIVMPICTQISMRLHKNGTIRLFRESGVSE